MREEAHRADWQDLMDRFHIGNAIVKQANPLSQVRFLNDLQRNAKIPLLVAADAEWGLAMRMQDTIAFPLSRTLGAIGDLDLLYQTGAEIGRQARRVGIHLNLAPVADINTNRANPIIGMRSFGEDPDRVASSVAALLKGMQSSGIYATAKHFPGHGDTSEDSHRMLPVVPHALERIEEIELAPFRRAIAEGVGAIMTGHLLVPAIDPELPATLSSACVTGLLRREMGFQGLVVTDALNMKALDSWSVEEIAVAAVAAGCDLLLYGDHIAPRIDAILRDAVPRAWRALKQGFEEGSLSVERLDESVQRILQAKEALQIHLVDEEGLYDALHSEEALRLKKKLFREAISIRGELFPLPKKTACLSVGRPCLIAPSFEAAYFAELDLGPDERRRLERELKQFDAVVCAIHQVGPRGQNYGYSPDLIALLRSLPRAILCHFATPYALDVLEFPGPLLVAFENAPDAQQAALERICRDSHL